ncbi:MAG: hypothetical protein AAB611_03110 [Patescibacteria group bacterium]
MTFFLQIIGWLGTALVVLGYFLVSSNRMRGTSTAYQLINLFGALFLGIHMALLRTWPGLTLQIVWGIIAIFSLIRHREK